MSTKLRKNAQKNCSIRCSLRCLYSVYTSGPSTEEHMREMISLSSPPTA